MKLKSPDAMASQRTQCRLYNVALMLMWRCINVLCPLGQSRLVANGNAKAQQSRSVATTMFQRLCNNVAAMLCVCSSQFNIFYLIFSVKRAWQFVRIFKIKMSTPSFWKKMLKCPLWLPAARSKFITSIERGIIIKKCVEWKKWSAKFYIYHLYCVPGRSNNYLSFIWIKFLQSKILSSLSLSFPWRIYSPVFILSIGTHLTHFRLNKLPYIIYLYHFY